MPMASPAPSGEPRHDGSWRAVSSGPERGLRILHTLFCFVPLRVAYVLVLPVVCTWFLHYNRPRGAVIRAMRRLGSKVPFLAAFGVYLQFAFTLVDRWYVRTGRAKTRVRMAKLGSERWELDALAGRPLVILGSHCGALEFGAGPLDALGWKVRPLAHPDTGADPLLSQVGDPSQEVDGGRPPIVADGSMAAGLRMRRALSEGETLAMKADRAIPGTERVDVPFLGSTASFPEGPARLVLSTGASALAVSVFREGAARYVIHKSVVRSKGRDERRIMADYARCLEEHLRLAPHQWFNFYPFWEEDRAPLEELPETVPPLMRRFGPWVAAGAGLGLLTEVALRALGL